MGFRLLNKETNVRGRMIMLFFTLMFYFSSFVEVSTVGLCTNCIYTQDLKHQTHEAVSKSLLKKGVVVL